MSGTKRSRDSATAGAVLASSSREEVREWLRSVLPAATSDAFLDSCAKENVEGAVLFEMTEADMKRLGLKTFGARRRLTLALKDQKTNAMSKAKEKVEEKKTNDDDVGEQLKNESNTSAAESEARAVEVENQLNAEASCVGICRWAASSLHKTLSSYEHSDWASPLMKRGRCAALSSLRSEIELPKASVVVVGNTGAGKSTLLNALLGEREVLPTNGMRACTAVVTELSYNSDEGGPAYVGEVEFISVDEWESELEDLLGDLSTAEGRAVLHASEDAHNRDSWCRLFAVYGETFTHSSVPTGEVVNGRRVYKAMMVEDLRKKLKRCTVITNVLGTKRRVTANDARSFRRQLERYTDSSNETEAGQYWPLVRKCRASGRWDVLRTGATLVDAPGVNDDNTARDRVVRSYLREADAVWIVSNINRAVNDKTARDMLDHRFRRQLLMDGNYGAVVFVATQSDVLQRSEVVRSLGLSKDASLETCALERNAFTERRVRADYVDGLAEMAQASGDDATNKEELSQRYSLPVFCVSAVEHQKLTGVRTTDGPATVWRCPRDTGVPALIEHVHNATLAARAKAVRRQTEAVVRFGASIMALCDAEPKPRDPKLAAVFEETIQPLTNKLNDSLTGLDDALSGGFTASVAPRLAKGAADARRKCAATARQWSEPWTKHGGGGGLHWATYKACCRREGAWRTNMNEELASPILESVGAAWESVFVAGLDASLTALSSKVVQITRSFHDDLGPRLQAAGVDEVRVRGVRAPLEAGAEARARDASDRVRRAVRDTQKELSRSIAPVLQNRMKPAYQRGYQETGTGSHRRRVAIVENHIDAQADSMFEDSVHPITEAMIPLRKQLRTLVEDACVAQTINDLRENYGVLWEATSVRERAARLRMRPVIETAVTEACTALKRLLQSQGVDEKEARAAAASARGVDADEKDDEKDDQGNDDEDVVDVTDACREEKRKHKPTVEIDLSDEKEEADSVVSGVGNNGPKSNMPVAVLNGTAPSKIFVKMEKV